MAVLKLAAEGASVDWQNPSSVCRRRACARVAAQPCVAVLAPFFQRCSWGSNLFLRSHPRRLARTHCHSRRRTCAQLNRSALHIAARAGDVELTRALVRLKANVNLQNTVRADHTVGHTGS